MKRKILKFIMGGCVVFAVALGIVFQTHPIILKWMLGTARIIGKPVNAVVYTNGRLNNDVKVFYVDQYWNDMKADNYIVDFSETKAIGYLKFINIDTYKSTVGYPSGSSKNDYDIICGRLFQSEVGGRFTDFRNDVKGFGFDPGLLINEKQIGFNIPQGKQGFDSVSILLR